MQLLSGCPPLVYWAGSYAWDLLMHSCVCLLAMLIFVIYQDKATTATPQQVCALPGCDRAPKFGVALNSPATLKGSLPEIMRKGLIFARGSSNPAGFFQGCHTLMLSQLQ